MGKSYDRLEIVETIYWQLRIPPKGTTWLLAFLASFQVSVSRKNAEDVSLNPSARRI